jgi:hypothetical protein
LNARNAQDALRVEIYCCGTSRSFISKDTPHQGPAMDDAKAQLLFR